MKKVVSLAVLLMVFSVINVQAADFSLTLGAGIRNIGEKDLAEEIYGTGNMSYYIDLGYNVSPALQIFLHTDYFSVKGELTFTKEETTLTLTPIELGARYFLGKKRFFPYVGLGAGYYMYKEENVIGTIDGKGFGFFGEAGFKVEITGPIFIDLKLKNVFLKVDGANGQIDLGGLSYMGGIGLAF